MAGVAAAQDRDCNEFATQAAAQAVYNANPADLYNLDADNDRKACEWLPNERYEDGSAPATTTPTKGVETGAGGTADLVAAAEDTAGDDLRTAAAAGHRGRRRARRGRPGAGPAPIGPEERLTRTRAAVVRTAERPAGRRIRLTVVVALLLPLALLGGCGRWREEINGQVAEPVRIRVPIDRSRCAGPAPDGRRERRPACSRHLRGHRMVERRPGAGRTRPRRDRRTPRLLPRARGLLPPQGPQRAETRSSWTGPTARKPCSPPSGSSGTTRTTSRPKPSTATPRIPSYA